MFGILDHTVGCTGAPTATGENSIPRGLALGFYPAPKLWRPRQLMSSAAFSSSSGVGSGGMIWARFHLTQGGFNNLVAWSFLGVLIIRALLFGVLFRASDFWKRPYRPT